MGASTEAPVLAQSPAPPPSSLNLYYSSFFLYYNSPRSIQTHSRLHSHTKHSHSTLLKQLQLSIFLQRSLVSVQTLQQQNHILDNPTTKTPTQGYPGTLEFMSIENLKTFGEFTLHRCVLSISRLGLELFYPETATCRADVLKRIGLTYIQTPSPRQTKTQERPNSRRITFIFVFSVRSNPHLALLAERHRRRTAKTPTLRHWDHMLTSVCHRA